MAMPEPTDRREDGVTAVHAGQLVDGVSLTLVRNASGWRFHGWAKGIDVPLAMQPTEADRDRHFDTADAATAYFKQAYARLLLGG